MINVAYKVTLLDAAGQVGRIVFSNAELILLIIAAGTSRVSIDSDVNDDTVLTSYATSQQ